MKEETDDIVRLPKQGSDMLDFLQQSITAAVQEGLDAEAIINTVHDYTCYWLMALDMQSNPAEPSPITPRKH